MASNLKVTNYYQICTSIFIIIFSSGSASPTYIIAFAGIAICFVTQLNPDFLFIALFIFAFVLNSLSPTHFILKLLKFIRLYSLKALP